MGVFLSQEEMWDRPLGVKGYGRQVPHWLGNILYVVLGFLCKVIFRYHIDGRQNIRAFRDRQGVVVVGNHTSFLDVVFMYLAIRPSQWVRLLGRDTLFEAAHGLGGQVLSRVGAFPIKRDTADRTALKRAAAMLKRGEVVGIFPEGTRRGKGTKDPDIHGGAALIARMGSAPILPMTVRNAEEVKQKGRGIRLPKITVEFGKPLGIDQFDFLPKEDRLDGFTWYAMRECFALSRRIPANEVDMAQLFPNNKDFTDMFEGRTIETFSFDSKVLED